MKSQFLEDPEGNKSNSRRIGFFVIIAALILAQEVLVFAYLEGTKVMVSSTAAGTLFLTIAGSAMYFLFKQKKTESNEVIAKVESQIPKTPTS